MTLSDDEIRAIEANLFSAARDMVRLCPTFSWHRDGHGTVTAGQTRSSQALAIDLFGTVRNLSSKNVILTAWARELGFDSSSPWSVDLEVLVPKPLLGEPR